MRICIVGCGAVGSLFAANLATLDDVEGGLSTGAQAHVDAIGAHGLPLCGAGACMRACTPPAILRRCRPASFGIVATKAMHAESAIAATAHAFTKDAVASVMNSVGDEEALAQHVGRVVRGTTFPAGKLVEPGVVQSDIKGDATLGPFEPKPAPPPRRSSASPTPARARGVPAHAVADARPAQWRKVIFDAARNPSARSRADARARVRAARSARAGQRPGRRGQGRRGAAQGIVLDADPEALIDHAAKPEVAYDHKASMLQDVEARRRTEIDYLNGGIVSFGAASACRRRSTKRSPR